MGFGLFTVRLISYSEFYPTYRFVRNNVLSIYGYKQICFATFLLWIYFVIRSFLVQITLLNFIMYVR